MVHTPSGPNAAHKQRAPPDPPRCTALVEWTKLPFSLSLSLPFLPPFIVCCPQLISDSFVIRALFFPLFYDTLLKQIPLSNNAQRNWCAHFSHFAVSVPKSVHRIAKNLSHGHSNGQLWSFGSQLFVKSTNRVKLCPGRHFASLDKREREPHEAWPTTKLVHC